MNNRQVYECACEGRERKWRPVTAEESKDLETRRMEQRILTLEEENGNLQQVVCYLLTKNEALRHRLWTENSMERN